MTSDPEAFFALDIGSATTTASLIGRLDGRWRLIGSYSGPATSSIDTILRTVASRVIDTDEDLGAGLGLADSEAAETWPRITARSGPPGALSVVAATEATRTVLTTAASRAGWRVAGASLERDDVEAALALALRPEVSIILAGTGDPLPSSERDRAALLEAIVRAVLDRRPEATVVVAGRLALADLDDRPDRGTVVFGPTAVPRGRVSRRRSVGDGADPLVEHLVRLRARPDDPTEALGRSVVDAADLLGIRIEAIDIGRDVGRYAVAAPGGAAATIVLVPGAGLVPAVIDDAAIDDVQAWLTTPIDRVRLADRLRELGRSPWGGGDGTGAELRAAAYRAALVRLVEGAGDRWPADPPDLIVATGGVAAGLPGPAVALALADALRRAGASALAVDHARLLAPLGTIADERERRTLLADLAGDVLVPLGTVVVPAGIRAGRTAGRLSVRAGVGQSELELVAGALQLVDLPPGQSATAELTFRDLVRLGTRGRRFAVEASGGLGGLLIDLRDVPLRLPERLDQRRELLAAWQRALWLEVDG